ncbi:MAG: PEP-CTERM sorting domain-containing protein [Pseudomonadota bacterium]
MTATSIKVLAAAAVMMLSSAVNALVITDVDNPFQFLSEGESHTVYHDLTDDGVPDEYMVNSARLRLAFSDGYLLPDWSYDVADISSDGVSGLFEVDGTHVFGFDVRWLTVGQDGIDTLNAYGVLAVTVTAVDMPGGHNDFWWKKSKLIAHVTEVPAPATLLLLGLGLCGVHFGRRSRR